MEIISYVLLEMKVIVNTYLYYIRKATQTNCSVNEQVIRRYRYDRRLDLFQIKNMHSTKSSNQKHV